jgi:exonuclease VII large subunit
MSENKTNTKITIHGEVINIGEPKNGYTDYVVTETDGEYPAVVCFSWKDDKLQNPPRIADTVEMSGYVKSNEWNGRYFTNIRGTFSKIKTASESPPQSDNIPDDEDPFEG